MLDLDNSYVRRLFFFLIAFFFILFIYLICFSFFEENFTNWVFVDGVTWSNFILAIISGQYGFFSVRSSSGLIGYYLILIYIGGLWLVLLNNLIFYGWIFVTKKFDYLAYLFFPFYFICFLLPSKDLMVVIPFYLFIFSLNNSKYISAAFLSFIVFLIRDAFGLTLFIFLIVYLFKFRVRICLFLIFILLIILDFYLIDIADFTKLFMFERTLDYFSRTGTTYYPYIMRLIANLTNLTSRAVFISFDGEFSWTGFSFFLAGIGILYAFVISFYYIFLRKKNIIITKLCYLTCSINIFIVLFFSFSPLIQPRYLIAPSLSVICFADKINYKKKFLLVAFVLLFLISLRYIYILLGFRMPIISDYNDSLYNLI